MVPEEDFEGHGLPGGFSTLSPHGKWMCSFGADGMLSTRAISNLVCIRLFKNSLRNVEGSMANPGCLDPEYISIPSYDEFHILDY